VVRRGDTAASHGEVDTRVAVLRSDEATQQRASSLVARIMIKRDVKSSPFFGHGLYFFQLRVYSDVQS